MNEQEKTANIPPSPDASAEIVRHPSSRQIQRIGEFETPFKYEIWGDGLYYEKEEPHPGHDDEPTLTDTPSTVRRAQLKRICERPLWLSGFANAIDTDEEVIELSFTAMEDPTDVRKVWVSREILSNRRQLESLAKYGLPIRSGNAQFVESFIAKSIAKNGPRFEWAKMATRSGRYDLGDDGFGWLLGRKWVGPEETKVVLDPRNKSSLVTGYELSGSEAAWFKKFREISETNSTTRWLCYSTFAAPLLRIVKTRTFIIHHWGHTGSGKTAVGKFAMSAWGDAHKLTATFNRTEKSFTEMFSYIADLPIMFDELQASTNSDHANIIYALCLERGRGRAGQKGGLEAEIGDWRSVVRMTGEEPIIGNGKVNLGGQTGRVLQLNSPALDRDQAADLHRWMEEKHHGWGGLRFAERLVAVGKDPALVQRLRERFKRFYNHICDAVPEISDRAGNVAVCALAQYLAARWFYQDDEADAEEVALSDAVEISRITIQGDDDDTLPYEKGLQAFRDHHDSLRKLWFSLGVSQEANTLMEGRYAGVFGILHPNNNEVWLLQSQANAYLHKIGLPPMRIWTDLKREGILLTDRGNKNLSRVRKAGAFRNRVYVLRYDRFFPPDETPTDGGDHGNHDNHDSD